MLDKIILSPYYLFLAVRHGMYNKGFIVKSVEAEVPTVCIGNITAGGTGKTPHVEMILRLLQLSDDWAYRNIAVLSRGYKRESRGFQHVASGERAMFYGDEPVQIKKKYPAITVAVDKDRIEGSRFLCHPDQLLTSKKARKCEDKDFAPSDLIVLDDAFQYRRLKATYNVVLVDYNRPVTKDSLIPFGHLRDLPGRLRAADAIIVTKCPHYMEDEDRIEFLSILGYNDFDPQKCEAKNRKGAVQKVFFSCINYQPLVQIYEQGDTRYIYSHKAILFSGVARDTPLRMFLSDKYRIVKRFAFGDHHRFSKGDIAMFAKAVRENPTAALVTTEKDSQRLVDCTFVPEVLKQKLFQVPIETAFLSENEEEVFVSSMLQALSNKQ